MYLSPSDATVTDSNILKSSKTYTRSKLKDSNNRNIGTQNRGVEKVPVKNLAIQYVTAQNIPVQSVSVKNIAVQKAKKPWDDDGDNKATINPYAFPKLSLSPFIDKPTKRPRKQSDLPKKESHLKRKETAAENCLLEHQNLENGFDIIRVKEKTDPSLDLFKYSPSKSSKKQYSRTRKNMKDTIAKEKEINGVHLAEDLEVCKMNGIKSTNSVPVQNTKKRTPRKKQKRLYVSDESGNEIDDVKPLSSPKIEKLSTPIYQRKRVILASDDSDEEVMKNMMVSSECTMWASSQKKRKATAIKKQITSDESENETSDVKSTKPLTSKDLKKLIAERRQNVILASDSEDESTELLPCRNSKSLILQKEIVKTTSDASESVPESSRTLQNRKNITPKKQRSKRMSISDESDYDNPIHNKSTKVLSDPLKENISSSKVSTSPTNTFSIAAMAKLFSQDSSVGHVKNSTPSLLSNCTKKGKSIWPKDEFNIKEPLSLGNLNIPNQVVKITQPSLLSDSLSNGSIQINVPLLTPKKDKLSVEHEISTIDCVKEPEPSNSEVKSRNDQLSPDTPVTMHPSNLVVSKIERLSPEKKLINVQNRKLSMATDVVSPFKIPKLSATYSKSSNFDKNLKQVRKVGPERKDNPIPTDASNSNELSLLNSLTNQENLHSKLENCDIPQQYSNQHKCLNPRLCYVPVNICGCGMADPKLQKDLLTSELKRFTEDDTLLRNILNENSHCVTESEPKHQELTHLLKNATTKADFVSLNCVSYIAQNFQQWSSNTAFSSEVTVREFCLSPLVNINIVSDLANDFDDSASKVEYEFSENFQSETMVSILKDYVSFFVNQLWLPDSETISSNTILEFVYKNMNFRECIIMSQFFREPEQLHLKDLICKLSYAALLATIDEFRRRQILH